MAQVATVVQHILCQLDLVGVRDKSPTLQQCPSCCFCSVYPEPSSRKAPIRRLRRVQGRRHRWLSLSSPGSSPMPLSLVPHFALADLAASFLAFFCLAARLRRDWVQACPISSHDFVALPPVLPAFVWARFVPRFRLRLGVLLRLRGIGRT